MARALVVQASVSWSEDDRGWAVALRPIGSDGNRVSHNHQAGPVIAAGDSAVCAIVADLLDELRAAGWEWDHASPEVWDGEEGTFSAATSELTVSDGHAITTWDNGSCGQPIVSSATGIWRSLAVSSFQAVSMHGWELCSECQAVPLQASCAAEFCEGPNFRSIAAGFVQAALPPIIVFDRGHGLEVDDGWRRIAVAQALGVAAVDAISYKP